VFDRFQAQGGDPKLLRPVIGVERQYLEAALDEMGKEFGTIEGYFAEGLGLDADAQSALRAALLESS
jgi:protein-tyrosine phosphatase